jgi:hypothetical protein
MNDPFVQRDEGKAAFDAIDDPITKNLVRIAVGMMTVRALPFHKPGSPAERVAEPPVSPIDYAFFVRLMRDMFENREKLQKVMAGESIESAYGWDPS